MLTATMSTTTILDTYDTQMFDYSGDLDVPMHPSTEAWFQGEATMEDDSALHKSGEENNSVEVDMEGYAGDETTEYEMADEVDLYHVETNEPVDVEVYDLTEGDVHGQGEETHMASHGLSDTHLINHVEVNTSTSTPGFSSRNYLELPSTPRHTEKSHITPTKSNAPAVEHLANALRPTTPEASYSETGDTSKPLPSSTHVGTNDEFQLSDPVHLPQVDLNDSNHEEAEGSFTHDDGHDEPSAEHDDPTDVSEETQLAVDISSAEPQQYEDETHEEVTSSGDPHEISDGVYIDPPPAVLLSLPALDISEVCLFNRPTLASGAASPSEGAEPAPSLELLLHYRPTLYYEPLSNVFEALRRESVVAAISETSDGELVLNAHDLQLVVSEDNVYARDITLHDLNILHDASGLEGPLRLSLQTVVPRFIHRYSMLREQVARLALGTDTEAPENAVEEEHNHENDLQNEETHEATEESTDETTGETTEEPTEELSEEPVEDLSNNTSQIQDPVSSPEISRKAPMLPLLESESGEVDNATVEDQEYYAEQRENGLSREFAAETSAETEEHELDANAIHEPTDTDDTGHVEEEYTEYDEHADYREGNDQLPDSSTELVEGDTAEHEEVLQNAPLLQEDETDEDGPQVSLDIEETVGAINEAASSADGVDHTGKESEQHPHQNQAQPNLQAESIHESRPDTPFTFLKTSEPEASVGAEEVDQLIAGESEQADSATNSVSYSKILNPDAVVVMGDPEELEEDWDDSLDGEGDPDVTWELDEQDAASNQSSLTLSSTKSSSKRVFDEVELDEIDDGGTPPGTSELKRPRVQ